MFEEIRVVETVDITKTGVRMLNPSDGIDVVAIDYRGKGIKVKGD